MNSKFITSKKLLERVSELNSRRLDVDLMDVFESRAFFLKISDCSLMFDRVSGYSRNSKNYVEAGDMHREMLRDFILCYPEWRKEISSEYLYYG